MASPKKILHLIKSLGRGGAEMLLPETLRHHNKGMYTCCYGYFLPWKDQMVVSLENQGAEVTCFNAGNNIEILFRIPDVLRFIRKEKIEILHCHLPWAGICGRLIRKFSGIPVVYTEHNKQERYHFITRWINLLTLNWNTTVVAVSQEVADSICRFKGNSFPVSIIKNGVDIEKYSPAYGSEEIRKQLGISENDIVIGNACVFRKQKRLREWIQVASSLCQHHARLHFILVGDGPLHAELMEQSNKLRLEKRVSWTGLREDVRPYIAAMDIFMLTSEFEGLPVALLEAMAMEKAIVSTSAGGIPEVVEDGISGLLVPVDCPLECGDKVNELLSSPEKIKFMGKAARMAVRRNFNVQDMVQKLEALYDKIKLKN